MTVTCSYIIVKHFITKLFLYCFNQNCCVLCRDFAGAMVDDGLFFIWKIIIGDCDHIGTDCHISVFHSYTDGQRFQWGTSCVIDFRVITAYCHIGCVTARCHSFRNGMYKSDLRLFCKGIHCRSLCIFQRRFSIKFRNRSVCHTVA